MPRRTLVLLVILAVASPWALADIVTLKDGTTLEGDVKKTDRGWRITTADGQTVEVSADKVTSIQLGKSAPTEDRATADLQSLRRSVENATDPFAVIERFKRFIEANPNAPAAAEAQKDIAIWQARIDQGLIKHGSNWIVPKERTRLAEQALSLTANALAAFNSGRLADAERILVEALAYDPQCAPAHYLRGVMQFQKNQMPAARKSFEAVNTIIKDHAPTLNNLAVILARQKAVMQSLSTYDNALTAAPVTKHILDNVIVALATLSEKQKTHRIAEQLQAKFDEQDARLQYQLAAKGLYRWGADWIDEAAMQKIRDQNKEINDQIMAIEESIKNDREQLRKLDERLAWVQAEIKRIYLNTPVPARHPAWLRMPFPPEYFELQDEEKQLLYDRAPFVPKVADADAEILRLRMKIPRPKITGTQKIIGVEGMPGHLSVPTTAPTTVPTAAPSK